MIKVNANLLRIANLTASAEDARFYLNGVHIEPHACGAIMVATDGHRMLCILDRDGETDKSATVRLSKSALTACRPKNRERRMVAIDETGTATVTVQNLLGQSGEWSNPTAVGISPKCLVDGTFPDWRRAMPEVKPTSARAAFDAEYIGSMAEVGRMISGKIERPAMVIVANEPEAPAVVRWLGVDDAFAILMPVRWPGIASVGLPDFLGNTAKRKAA